MTELLEPTALLPWLHSESSIIEHKKACNEFVTGFFMR